MSESTTLGGLQFLQVIAEQLLWPLVGGQAVEANSNEEMTMVVKLPHITCGGSGRSLECS